MIKKAIGFTLVGLISLGALAQAPKSTDNFNVVLGSNPPSPPPITATNKQKDEMSSLGQQLKPTAKEGIDMLVPLTPREIRYLELKMMEMQRAKGQSFNPPERKIRTLVLEQEPGKKPPEIYMYQGHSTTLVLVDGEGKPWPVERYKIGNPTAYTVTSADTGYSSHILDITPVSMFVPTNLTIILADNPMPIVFDLKSIDNRTDSLVTVTVGGISPTNDAPSVASDDIPDLIYNNAKLSPFLDNTPPDGAIVISVLGDPEMSVWYWNNHFIVRTRNTLTYPNAGLDGRKMSTPDGRWHVYQVSKSAPPVFSLLDNQGNFKQVTVAVDEVTR